MLASLLLLANLTFAAPVLPVQDESDNQTPPTQSQQNCGPREELLNAIKKKYGAEPLFVAMTAQQGVAFEVWHNTSDVKEHGDRWIGFISDSRGISCVVLRGLAWGLATSPDPDAKKPIPLDETN